MRLVGGFFLFMMALAHGRTAPSHLAPDCVLIGTVDGRVVCLDAQSGALRWTLDTGGPLVSRTGPPQYAPPFIPALTSDGTLFRLQHDPPRLQKVNASLYSLLQPMHSEFHGHTLLTSKQTRLFEVDCATGEPAEPPASGPGPLVRISRHDVTIEGRTTARKGDWQYTVGNLFMSQPSPAPGGGVRCIDDDKEANRSALDPEVEPLPPMEVLVSGHDKLAVGVASGRVVWQHPLPSRPVAAYLLQRVGGLVQLPLLLYPLQRDSSADPWRAPALMVDSFDGLQYALVAKGQELPQELMVLPGVSRPLLPGRVTSGELTPPAAPTPWGPYPLHFAAVPGIRSLACPVLPKLLEYAGADPSVCAAEVVAAPSLPPPQSRWHTQWLKAVALVAAPAVVASFFDPDALGWAALLGGLVALSLIATAGVLVRASWANVQWSTLLLTLNRQLRQEKEQLQHQTTLQSEENGKLKQELERRQQETEELRRQLEVQAIEKWMAELPFNSSTSTEPPQPEAAKEAAERPGRPRRASAEWSGEDNASESSGGGDSSASGGGGLMSRFFVKGDELSDDDDASEVPGPAPVRSLYRSNFTELRQIAQGGFGKVFLVRSNTDQREYALKKIFLHSVSPEEAQRRRAEAVLSSKLDHRNVVRYYTSWVEANVEADALLPSASEWSESDTGPSQAPSTFSLGARQVLYILMEYYSHGTLSALFQQWSEAKAPIVVADVHSIFKQLVKGTSYLHGSCVLHRDLKPSNIFVARESLHHNDTLKIGDFGLSCDAPGPGGPEVVDGVASVRLSPQSLTTGIGSPLYAAPEQMGGRASKGGYGEKADIFSLGIIFFECFLRPDTSAERHDLLSTLRDRHRVPAWLQQKYPLEMALILDMTRADPAQRPSLEEIGQRLKALCLGRKTRSPPFRPVRPAGHTPPTFPEDGRPSSARRRGKPRSGTGSLSPPIPPMDGAGVARGLAALAAGGTEPPMARLALQPSYSLASDASVESGCGFSRDLVSPILAALA
eukprot:EG_transcript_1834